MLCYRIDWYSHNYKHALETDENGYSNRNIEYEIKRQRAIDQEIGCEFIRNDNDKERFDILKTVNEIFRYIKQSSFHYVK